MIFEMVKFFNIKICEEIFQSTRKLLTLRDIRGMVASIATSPDSSPIAEKYRETIEFTVVDSLKVTFSQYSSDSTSGDIVKKIMDTVK